jgi:hypothetical protein
MRLVIQTQLILDVNVTSEHPPVLRTSPLSISTQGRPDPEKLRTGAPVLKNNASYGRKKMHHMAPPSGRGKEGDVIPDFLIYLGKLSAKRYGSGPPLYI